MYEPRKTFDKFHERVKQYEALPVKEGCILFYGDSGFTRWRPEYDNNELSDDIRAKDGSEIAVNHGLGGANSDQLLYWYYRMVRPWKPRALVFKAYVNDRAQGYTVDEIMYIQSRIFEFARTDMPGIKIYVLDCQPTVKNNTLNILKHHRNEYHQRLEEYCRRHDDTKIIWTSLHPDFYQSPEDVGDFEKLRPELFIEDGVHFTREGYSIFANCIRFAISDEL